MPSSLLRRKDVDACQEDAERSEHRLKRSLGVFNLTALGIGAVIGAGIFSAIGTAASGGANHVAAGPALVVSYVLVALACGFAALCYAEMAAMVPVAGSAYTYAYVTLGEFVAWIIGWDLILEYAVGNVAVAVSWADYFKSLLAGLGLHLPDWLSTTVDHAQRTPGLLASAPHLFGIPIVLNLPAGLIIAVLTVLLVIGIQESARVNTAMVPVAGSAYTYAYVTLGELVAWIIGWDLILEYAVGNVAVAVSWADYFKSLLAGLGLNLPDWLTSTVDHAQRTPGLLASAPHLFGIPIVVNLPAGLIIAVLTVLLVIGIQESARVNTAMVVLKLVMVVGFVAVGTFYVTPAHWTPFAPNGLHGILSGASLIFFAYIGFDAVSTTAEEARNPQRDIPRAMIATLGICTVLYAAVTLVLTGMVGWQTLGVGDPLAQALQSAGLQAAAGILSFGAVIAMTAVLLVFQLGQPRIFMVMARDGLLPAWAAKVHPRFRTPYVTTILTGLAVGIPAMFVDINEAIEFTNIGTLFAFILVSVGVIVLRRTDPGRHRPFRCPGVPWLPLLSIVGCGILMAYLPLITWIRFVVWQAAGVALYFLYGRRHSRLATQGVEETMWTDITSR